ncbi:NUDIX hydrolase domain-like protein [Pilaira anomala]|nr:NUDIX hydrolase domain-like protein [Pilaira anomala]
MGNVDYPTEPRTGRDRQVYDKDLVRQVAGCVAFDPKTNKFLVISSSKHQDVWVLPKGGWEDDETKEQAAERETYEEAGVRGTLKGLIGSFMDYDISGQPKSNVWFFELEVEHILNEWPESNFRQRKWCTLEEALQYLRFKPFMQKAILASSFGKK